MEPEGMMVVFFVGIGLMSILTGLSQTPLQLGIGLFVSACLPRSITRSVSAIVVASGRTLACGSPVNGVWGNLGVASRCPDRRYFIDTAVARRVYRAGAVLDPDRLAIAGCYARKSRLAATSTRRRQSQARRPITGRYCCGSPYRVRDDRHIQHRLSIDDIRIAENLRRAPAEHRRDLGGRAEHRGLPGRADVATIIGSLAFVVFAVASMAQLVVGSLPRTVSARVRFS